MTPLRLLVNAIVGGFLLFAWGAIASLVLHVDEFGLSRLAHEPEFVAAVQAGVGEPGLYAFPARPPGAGGASDRLERVRSGASGLLLVHPAGREPDSSARYLVVYLADVAAALLAGFLLWLAAPRVRTLAWRALFVAALGGAGSLSLLLPLWSEQGYPIAWVLALAARNVLGFALVGVFCAWRMKGLVPVPRPSPRTR